MAGTWWHKGRAGQLRGTGLSWLWAAISGKCLLCRSPGLLQWPWEAVASVISQVTLCVREGRTKTHHGWPLLAFTGVWGQNSEEVE